MNDLPPGERVAILGEELARRGRLESIEHELLLLAAAARNLSRLSEGSLARLAGAEAVGISMLLTGGRNRDVLGVLGDLDRLILAAAKPPAAS